ncbi:hypothetical protein [Sodalis sp. dw_96]|uniref:hypothetical protein n=1 Tax=Sodalis sp. dw_96 TaxID=2719794 RepID=UPI001BD557F5|nr:hypothetical protein [Sodalis sp. dw_96]
MKKYSQYKYQAVVNTRYGDDKRLILIGQCGNPAKNLEMLSQDIWLNFNTFENCRAKKIRHIVSLRE